MYFLQRNDAKFYLQVSTGNHIKEEQSATARADCSYGSNINSE